MDSRKDEGGEEEVVEILELGVSESETGASKVTRNFAEQNAAETRRLSNQKARMSKGSAGAHTPKSTHSANSPDAVEIKTSVASSNKLPIYRSVFDTSHIDVNTTENSINSTTTIAEMLEKKTIDNNEGVVISRARPKKRKIKKKSNFPKKPKVTESSNAPPKKTWRRGRKKKVLGNPVVKEEGIILGKRGRKKKNLDFPIEEPKRKRMTAEKRVKISVQEVKPIGKKRGRKPNNEANKGEYYRFECEQCGRKTRYLCDYKRHLNVHTKTPLFECGVCQRYYKHQAGLYLHMKSKHGFPNSEISDLARKKETIVGNENENCPQSEDSYGTVKTCEIVDYVHFLVDDAKTMVENMKENENSSIKINGSNKNKNTLVDFDGNSEANLNSVKSDGDISESASEDEEIMTENEDNMTENEENKTENEENMTENEGNKEQLSREVEENTSDDSSKKRSERSSENDGNMTENASENEENMTENASENEENMTDSTSENERNASESSNEEEAVSKREENAGINLRKLYPNGSNLVDKDLIKAQVSSKVSSHRNNAKTQFTCDICGKHFKREFRLFFHKKNVHSFENIAPRTKNEQAKKDQIYRKSQLIASDHFSTSDNDHQGEVIAKVAVRRKTTTIENASENRKRPGRPPKISNAGAKKYLVRNFSQTFECARCGEFLESDLSLSSHQLLVHGVAADLEKLKKAAKLNENRMKNTIPPENIPQLRERRKLGKINGKAPARRTASQRDKEPRRVYNAFICNLCDISFDCKNRFLTHVLHLHPDLNKRDFNTAISVLLDHEFVRKVLPNDTMSSDEEHLPETSPARAAITNDLEELEASPSQATKKEVTKKVTSIDESDLSSEIGSPISENDSSVADQFGDDISSYYCEDSEDVSSISKSDVVVSSYKKRPQSLAKNEVIIDSEEINETIESKVEIKKEISTEVVGKNNIWVDRGSDHAEIKNNQKYIISRDQEPSKGKVRRDGTDKKFKMEIDEDVKGDKSMEEYEKGEFVSAENTNNKNIVEKQNEVNVVLDGISDDPNEVFVASGVKSEYKESNSVEVGPKQSSEVSSSCSSGVADEKEVHKCDVCQMKFETKFSLRSHLDVHVRELQKCDACGRKFASLSRLEAHLMAHLSRTYECALCGWKFLSVENLERHKSDKHALNLQCSVCDRKFTEERILARHLLTHNYVSAYPCDKCDKVFMHEHFLRMHQSKHAKCEPFGCTICGMKFARVDMLKSHNATHDDEKEGDVWEEIINKASLDKEGGGVDGGRLPNYVQIAEMFESFWVDGESSGSD